jgi:hydroxyacylglutathione hydrolase
MHVTPIVCLQDNYAYLLWQQRGGPALVVDPGDAAKVLAVSDFLGLQLQGVLCTHHHADHVGGLGELAQRLEGLRVYGHVSDVGRIAHLTDPVEHGAKVALAGIELTAWHVPGHTSGGLLWQAEGVAFTGDTLFLGGCGRVFEGTAEQLWRSLDSTLGRLDDETLLYVGHEYTESNLRFGAWVEPDNERLAMRRARVRHQRAQGAATVPGTLGEERATNPFLRAAVPSVAARIGLPPEAGAEAVFAALRSAKDHFSG